MTAIRRARLEDAEALAALGERTFRATFIDEFQIPYPQEDLDPYLRAKYAPASFAKLIEADDCAVWVAEPLGRGLVGYATAGPCKLPHPDLRPGEKELHYLYVERAVFGTGLGVQLMDVAMAWLDPHGDARTWLGVWSGNERAQRFYRRYGFEKVGEYDYPVGKWLDREFIMRRG